MDSSVLVAIISTIGGIFSAAFIYMQNAHTKKSKAHDEVYVKVERNKAQLEKIRQEMIEHNTILILTIANVMLHGVDKDLLEPLIEQSQLNYNDYEKQKRSIYEEIDILLR